MVKVNPNLQQHKKKARQNLWSEKGLYLRKKCCVEPEPVFGQIKWNRGFRRFLLRSLSKITCEFGIVAIAHNLKKMWVRLQKATTMPNPPVLTPENDNITEKTPKNDFFIIFRSVMSHRTPHHEKFLNLKCTVHVQYASP
jgi:hypothetical protein